MDREYGTEIEGRISDLRDFAYRQTVSLERLLDAIEMGSIETILETAKDIVQKEETTVSIFNKHYPSFTGVLTGENNE